jgi:transposase
MLTHTQFDAIAPFLPIKRRPPTYTDKSVLNAVLYMLSSGCSWRQLPREYGRWHTIYTRFKRWSDAGVMDRVLHELQRQKIIGVHAVFLDSTIVRAHQSASGARKKRGRRRSAGRGED